MIEQFRDGYGVVELNDPLVVVVQIVDGEDKIKPPVCVNGHKIACYSYEGQPGSQSCVDGLSVGSHGSSKYGSATHFVSRRGIPLPHSLGVLLAFACASGDAHRRG